MIGAAAIAALMLPHAAFAQKAESGSAAEAKALLEKAVAELKAGEAAALSKFNAADGGYRDRDLYVYCFDAVTGKFTAQAKPALIGTDVRALKEKDGSPLGQKLFDGVKEGAVTTVDYNFPKPGGADPVPKEAFLTRVGAEACGVGYYK
jgi:signal transduction histidine kinase